MVGEGQLGENVYKGFWGGGGNKQKIKKYSFFLQVPVPHSN